MEEVAVEGESFGLGVFTAWCSWIGLAGDVVGGAVECVADYGMAECLEVDADLVGAACLDADLDEGEVAVVGGVDALKHLDVRDGGADTFTISGAASGHADASDEVTADGEVDGDVVFCKAALEVSVDEGDIGLFELAGGEHLAELAMRAVVFGNEDDSAGLFVEAVDDARAEFAADLRELVEVMEESVDEGSAVALVDFSRGSVAGAGVDHHACGLVDDGQVLVLVKDVEGDVLGEGVERWRVGSAFDLDLLAALEFELGFGWLAVDANLSVLDEQLDAGAGDIGDGLGKVLVEAEAGGLGGCGEGAGTVLGFVFNFEDRDDGCGDRLDTACGEYGSQWSGLRTLEKRNVCSVTSPPSSSTLLRTRSRCSRSKVTVRVERYPPHLVCLRVLLDADTAVKDVAAADLDRLRVEVDVAPSQGAHLATTHAGCHHQPDERAPVLIELECRIE